MRDEELRRLERASAERGDASSEARHLLERVRRGDLAQERLELAAYVGHAAARLALEGSATEPPAGLAEWLVGLDRWGRDAKMRAAIVISRLLSRHRSHYDRWSEDDGSRRVLEAAEACFLDPSDTNKLALDRALEPGEGRYSGGGASAFVASLVRAPDSLDENFARFAEQIADARSPVHARNVREDVRDDLAPWALGQLDPLATRPQREGKRFSSEDDEIVRSIAFFPDGSRVVVSNQAGNVRLRAFPSGELVRELPKGRQVFVVAVSPDGSRFATADDSGWVRVYLADTGAELAHVRFGDEAIYGLAFLGGTERVAVGAVGGKAAILELATGRTLVELAGHERSVTSLDVTTSGEQVATASADGKLRVFEARTGALVQTLECSAEDVAFLPDGRLVAGGSSGVVTLWDVKSGASDRFETKGPTVYAVAASPTGDFFAGAPSNLAPIFVWDASTGAVRKRFAWDMSTPLALACSPDGRHLLMGDRGGGVRLFEV